MSDQTPPERRPTPNPASRARRIGGRPTPQPGSRPSPTPNPTPTPAPSVGPPDQTIDPVADRASLAVDEPAAPEPTPEGAPAKQRRRRGWLRWLPALVLGAGVIALVVVVVIASHGVYWAKSDNSEGARTARQEQVLAAAKKCFAQINTYDYRQLTGLVQRDTTCTTGTFTKDLSRALTSQIIPIAPRLKATQTAQVNRAGIASVSPDGRQVVILMYGQLSQTNSSTAKTSPRIDVVGAVVTVNKVGDQWLISKVDTDVGNALGS
jgi:hypothetical protein